MCEMYELDILIGLFRLMGWLKSPALLTLTETVFASSNSSRIIFSTFLIFKPYLSSPSRLSLALRQDKLHLFSFL